MASTVNIYHPYGYVPLKEVLERMVEFGRSAHVEGHYHEEAWIIQSEPPEEWTDKMVDKHGIEYYYLSEPYDGQLPGRETVWAVFDGEIQVDRDTGLEEIRKFLDGTVADFVIIRLPIVFS